MLIQLPDDVKSVGYKEVSPFNHKQVFKSKSCNFEGTEAEFVKAGHGYSYIQVSDHKRLVLQEGV